MRTLFDSNVFKLGAIGLATAIAWLSLLPVTGQSSFDHADKIQHFVAYAVLAAGIGLGWRWMSLLWVFTLAVVFGIGVEIAQGIMPTGRTASVLDALANAAGAGVAVFGLQRWRAR